MHAVDALRRFGGTASRAQLLQLTDRHQIERALIAGVVVHDARGAFSLPTAPGALRAANAHAGVVSHLSAAAAHGWELKSTPELPHLTVPRNRNVDRAARTAFVPHWATLTDGEIQARVTSPERTVTDCLVSLGQVDAMCVADSAIRHGAFSNDSLQLLADGLTGPGCARARRIAARADGRAANPFESTLRCIALGVRGLHVEPQVTICEQGYRARPDLVDVRRRIVIEADSATWHTGRAALRRDCRRYTRLVLLGWLVLRFAWEDVMFDPDYVRRELVAAVERAQPGWWARRGS